ncbi:MAG: hypothetical protein IT236_07555 [Bacteroidia bacterium]|nr:hypothetical protein [Bacteroidia bacterium]
MMNKMMITTLAFTNYFLVAQNTAIKLDSVAITMSLGKQSGQVIPCSKDNVYHLDSLTRKKANVLNYTADSLKTQRRLLFYDCPGYFPENKNSLIHQELKKE